MSKKHFNRNELCISEILACSISGGADGNGGLRQEAVSNRFSEQASRREPPSRLACCRCYHAFMR